MRKMKKINGFLVVRFNDREKRDYPQLGSFGVIDAELYTGDLDFDLDAMEYIDADRIEIAVEQARGLDAEEDFGDEPPTYTVITETAEEATEEEVEPKLLVLSYEEQLKTQIKSPHYKDVDPRTAAHELYGYKSALCDLGLLDREDKAVDPKTFGDACEFYDDEGHRVDMALPSPAGLALVSAHDYEEGETFTGCTVQVLKCRRCGRESFAWSKGSPEEEAPPEEAERHTFAHTHPNIQRDRMMEKLYTLGLVLARDCPANDCKVYLNIFNMARDLDAALDTAEGYPALVLRQDLHKRLEELREMYFENYAIQKFKEGMKP